MKRCYLLLALLLTSPIIFAQKKFPVYLGASLNHAIGEFTTTHSFGFGIEAGSAKHWFESKKGKKINFSWKGGVSYYFGKKVITNGFSNKYSGYSIIHVSAGLQIIPIKKTTIRLFAGPGIGLYNGSTRFNIGTELDAGYLLKEKIAIGPAIILMKESGADAIWAVGLKANIKI